MVKISNINKILKAIFLLFREVPVNMDVNVTGGVWEFSFTRC